MSAPGSPPRVLLLHNRYRATGGEERVVDVQAALLAARGHAVARCERDSAHVPRARAARGLLRGGLDPRAVADAVRAHRADVVHAHNVHPTLGWRALAAARAAGARVVLQLHNFRLFCAIGIAYREGAPCYDCRGRDTHPGIQHRCRGSLPEALAYGIGLARQQPRLLREADALLAVSDAQAERLVALGVPPGRLAVVPNPVPTIAGASRAGEGSYALVSGRLVEEKGIDVAVRAAIRAGVPLRVAGIGPEEWRLRELAAGGDVRFLGWLDEETLAGERRGAAVVLAPSRCDEACPMAVLEALADGVPVLGSRRGALPELVGEDAALAGEDVETWAAALRALWADPAGRAAAGEAGLARIRARHAPDACYAGLLRAYGQR